MKHTASLGALFAAWIALLALLALTTASAYYNLGAGNLILNLGIAAAKVGLIVVVFMRLALASVAVRLTAAAELFFLFILAFLSSADFLTRPSHPAPWRAPESMRSV